jgi:hypothetical protein
MISFNQVTNIFHPSISQSAIPANISARYHPQFAGIPLASRSSITVD